MGRERASKVMLYVLSVVTTILGLAIAAASIWFFCQVYEFTAIRNYNHYALDYRVYWPQAVPWIFFAVSICVIAVSSCGFASAKKKSNGLIKGYITCLGAVVLLLVAASVVALVFADSAHTDNFVKDTVWDGYFQSKADNEAAAAFSLIERKYHCCGADSPRDYKNWKEEFPMSCCDVFYRGWTLDPYTIDCDFTNKLANERHGCSTVAAQYARIVIKVLSGVSIFTALLCIISLVFAVTLSKALSKRRRPPPQTEFESQKVLL